MIRIIWLGFLLGIGIYLGALFVRWVMEMTRRR